MLTISAARYFDAGVSAEDARTAFMLVESGVRHGDDRKVMMDDGARLEIKKSVEKLYEISVLMQLPISSHLIGLVKDDPPETEREFLMILHAIKSELQNINLLYVPQERAPYYDYSIRDSVTDSFPIASQELVLSAKCFAVGLHTACVFHAMRAAEIGVRALAKELGVSFPNKPIEFADWQQLLDQVDSKIKAISQQPQSVEKDNNQRFFSEAATQFRYFKDGWRARVAHARASYDETESRRVFDHVVDFFTSI